MYGGDAVDARVCVEKLEYHNAGEKPICLGVDGELPQHSGTTRCSRLISRQVLTWMFPHQSQISEGCSRLITPQVPTGHSHPSLLISPEVSRLISPQVPT